MVMQGSSKHGDAFARLYEAVGRVGRTPEERFNWLSDFARGRFAGYDRQAPELSLVDWDAKRCELLAFAATGWEIEPEAPIALTQLAYRLTSGSPEQSGLLGSEPMNEVLACRRKVGQALLEFIVDGRLRLTFTVEGTVRTDDRTAVPVPLLDLDSVNPDVTPWFLGTVSQLIIHLSVRLRSCKNDSCRWPFLPTARQIYCSRRCSQKVCAEHFRQAHPERVRATQRRAYHRKRQGKSGRSVKAASQSRKKAFRRNASKGK